MDGKAIYARSAITTKQFKKRFNNKSAINFVKETFAIRNSLNILI